MNSTYGGGWYMSDSSWLRSVNNKGIYTGGQVKVELYALMDASIQASIYSLKNSNGWHFLLP